MNTGATMEELRSLVADKDVVQLRDALLASQSRDPPVDLNAETADGQTLLTTAVNRNANIALALLVNQPSIDVNLGNSKGQSPLHLAIILGRVLCVHLLACRLKDVKIIDCLVLAVRHDRIDSLRVMLSADAPHTADEVTLAMFACVEEKIDRAECLSLLLSAPEIETPVNASVDGVTMVRLAAENGHKRCLRVLLQQPDIDLLTASTDGRRVTSLAIDNHHYECLAMLMKHEQLDGALAKGIEEASAFELKTRVPSPPSDDRPRVKAEEPLADDVAPVLTAEVNDVAEEALHLADLPCGLMAELEAGSHHHHVAAPVEEIRRRRPSIDSSNGHFRCPHPTCTFTSTSNNKTALHWIAFHSGDLAANPSFAKNSEGHWSCGECHVTRVSEERMVDHWLLQHRWPMTGVAAEVIADVGEIQVGHHPLITDDEARAAVVVVRQTGFGLKTPTTGGKRHSEYSAVTGKRRKTVRFEHPSPSPTASTTPQRHKPVAIDGIYPCPFTGCPWTHRYATSTSRHWISEHGGKIERPTYSKGGDGMYSCPSCDSKYSRASHLDEHWCMTHGWPLMP